jgi:hypothetical protein
MSYRGRSLLLVAIKDVRFDSTMREMLDPSVLDGIVLPEHPATGKKMTPFDDGEQLK